MITSSTKLKILFVIPTLGGGGAEILLGAIIQELFRRGHEILLVTMHPMDATFDNFPNKEFIEQNISIKLCSTRVLFSWRKKPVLNNSEFTRIVNSFSPDIIHSHLYEAEILAKSYVYPSAKYFSHCHDNMPQLKSLVNQRKISRLILTNLIERNWWLNQMRITESVMISISNDVSSYLKKNIPERLFEQVIKLPNAIDVRRFKTDIDRKLLKGNELILVSVGSLVPKKNHQLLIQIGSKLKTLSVPFRIQIIGSGRLMNSLKQQVSELGLSEFITFVGNVKDVEAYLKKADIYLHTAYYEPFGLVIIEAMAAGLPVICLDGGGNRELIMEGKNGFLIHENNPEFFVDKILQLKENPKLYIEISKFSEQYALQFDIVEYVTKLVQVYSK